MGSLFNKLVDKRREIYLNLDHHLKGEAKDIKPGEGHLFGKVAMDSYLKRKSSDAQLFGKVAMDSYLKRKSSDAQLNITPSKTPVKRNYGGGGRNNGPPAKQPKESGSTPSRNSGGYQSSNRGGRGGRGGRGASNNSSGFTLYSLTLDLCSNQWS